MVCLIQSNRLESRLRLEGAGSTMLAAISSSTLAAATMSTTTANSTTTTTTTTSHLQVESLATYSSRKSCHADFIELELKHGTLDDFFHSVSPDHLDSWSDFTAFLQNKILWTDRDVFVALRQSRAPIIQSDFYRPILSIDTSYFGPKVDIYAPVHSYIKNTLEGLLLLLSESKVSHLEIASPYDENVPLPCSVTFLEYFLTQNLHVSRFGLERLSLSSSQCETIARHVTPDMMSLDLVLTSCRLYDGGEALAKLVHQSEKLPSMGLCFSRTFLSPRSFSSLCQGLPTTQSLQSLQLVYMNLSSADLKLLASSLQNNTSLAWIDLRGNNIDDKSWQYLCQTLCNKPKLKYLGMANTASMDCVNGSLTPSRKSMRTRQLLDMARTNQSLYSIHSSICEHNQGLVEELDSLLLIHRCYPRALALAQISDCRVRSSILIKALASVRHSPDLLWTFLNTNLDTIVQH